MVSSDQAKLKPVDGVERGVPSWLSKGGTIVFGAKRPKLSPNEIEPQETQVDDFSGTPAIKEMPRSSSGPPQRSEA